MALFFSTLVSYIYIIYNSINMKQMLKIKYLFIYFFIYISFLSLFYFKNLFFFNDLNLIDYFINVFYKNAFGFFDFLQSINSFSFNYLDYPLFIWFGFLFLFSSLFSLFFLNYLGFYGIFVLNWITLFLFWSSCLPYFVYILELNGYYYINLGKWMNISSNFFFLFDFYIDNISFSFMFLTLSIAVFVYSFTFSYFRYEPLVDRLLILLNLFIISMVFLVTSGNLVSIFLGWELIGLTSFFLINFWVNKVSTLKAAFKAFSFNKLSDFFLLLNIFLIFNTYYTLDVISLTNQSVYFLTKNITCNFIVNISLNDLISLLFLGCAFIKSAQIGFHIWLPDSMEAPVPASALIHSATLVSAGIFLLLRFNFFFNNSILINFIICLIGSVTAFYGGLVSMYQSDTKRILAYSTISHCGFLMVLVSFKIVEFTLLYLYIHGFFKAGIFMSVGNVNRLNKNNQDFKNMGNFFKYLPFDCFIIGLGLLNLAGLPFTLGFFIKHLLFIGININFFFYYFILINLFFAAFTGLFYCSRLFFYVFFDFKKNKNSLYYLYSRKNLNSIFYSNSTLLATFSIIGLFIFAYCFSLYLFYIYFQSFLLYSDFNDTIKSSNFFYLFINNHFMLFNFSIFNWIVFILILLITFLNWRKITQEFNIQWFFWFFLFLFLTKCFL